MTNREKYAEQILDVACKGHVIAVDKEAEKVVDCTDFGCCGCVFDYGIEPCDTLRERWCNAEYVEPPVD